MGLGSSVVLNTEDGIGMAGGLLMPVRGAEAGCDLGMVAEVCARVGCPRGAGFV